MRPDLDAMIDQVSRLRVHAGKAGADTTLAAKIEDALSAGYAVALAGDAWSMKSEVRLHKLISDVTVPVRGTQVRELTSEHASFERDLIALRRALAELRRERDRLCAGSLAASG